MCSSDLFPSHDIRCHKQVGWKEVNTTHDWGMDKDILQRGVEEMNNIPVFNLYFESDLQKLRELVF